MRIYSPDIRPIEEDPRTQPFDILAWLRTEAILPDVDYRNQDILNDPTGYPMYVKAAALLKPESVLEIGTHYGAGLCAFLAGYQSRLGNYQWIDDETYHTGSNEIAYKNLVQLAKLLAPGITLVEYYGSIALFNESVGSKQFDLIHVDADHSFEGASHDLYFAESLRPRYILVDDFKMPEVKAAVKAFSLHAKLPFLVWDTLRGWAVFALNSEDFARLPDEL